MKEFNLIYNENYKWVLGLIKSKTNNAHESEEMTNDIFLKVYDNLDKYDGDKCSTGFTGWIRAIVWNKIIDFYRQKKLNAISIENFKDEDGKELYSLKSSTNIEAEYCTQELIDNAKDVIKMLPNPYKKLATLFYIKDYSYNEIVQQTGLSLGTIKGQLFRARTKMQLEFGIS